MSSSPIISRPRGLSEFELTSLSVWFAAIGKWDRAGLTETEGRSLTMQFFDCLKPPQKSALRNHTLSLQNTFMSLARGTFETIQKEPPFSPFARRNMSALLEGWLAGQEAGFVKTWKQIFSPGWETSLEEEVPIRVVENSGENKSTAIQIVTDDRNYKIQGEYWYLYYRYGNNWQCEMQMLLGPRIRLPGDDPRSEIDERRFDVLDIRFSNGHKQEFYFLL